MLSAYAGRLDSVKELRHNGASYTQKDRGGCTALHWAVDSGRVDVIDWMLEDGAAQHALDVNGWTPLMRTGERTAACQAPHDQWWMYRRT